MDALEKQLEQAWLKYSTEIESIARIQFIQFVKPYCDQKGYKFVTGKGDWSFTGLQFSNVPWWLVEILTLKVEGRPYTELGTLMPSYDPFKP